MTYKHSRRVSPVSLFAALFAALQWRLLLLWLVFLLLPTAIVALPLWKALGGLLDHSVHAPAWAGRLDVMVVGDVLAAPGISGGWLGGAALAAMLLTVFLAPLLDGMVVSGGRAGRTLGLGQLLQSGVIEYGRMFRLMLWALLPYAIVGGLAALGFGMASKHAEHAVLDTQASTGMHVAWWWLGFWFVLAQAVVESARAAFIADAGLRSATRALGRGFLQLLRRPFSTVLFYLVVTALGAAIAMAFGVARLHTAPTGLAGFLLALLLSQLVVVAMGWMRTARLLALAEVARSLAPSRRSPV